MNGEGVARWSVTIKTWSNDGTLIEDQSIAVAVDGAWHERDPDRGDPIVDVASTAIAAVRMLGESKAFIRPANPRPLAEIFHELADFERS